MTSLIATLIVVVGLYVTVVPRIAVYLTNRLGPTSDAVGIRRRTLDVLGSGAARLFVPGGDVERTSTAARLAKGGSRTRLARTLDAVASGGISLLYEDDDAPSREGHVHPAPEDRPGPALPK